VAIYATPIPHLTERMRTRGSERGLQVLERE
jgi:hypothetical protein